MSIKSKALCLIRSFDARSKMRSKLIVMFIALTLSVTTLTAGCTAPTNNAPNNTNASTQNALLAKMVKIQPNWFAERNFTISGYNVQWINSTTVKTTMTTDARADDPYVRVANKTYRVFPTTQAASTFVGKHNLLGYHLDTSPDQLDNIYRAATGHNASVHKMYVKYERPTSRGWYVSDRYVAQDDNVVHTTVWTVLPTVPVKRVVKIQVPQDAT